MTKNPHHQPQQPVGEPGELLVKWKCRIKTCKRPLLEYASNEEMRGLLVKICDKCGTINRMRDGVPEV